MTTDCDLLIVGGGPAGLSAAINGSSEGLKICIIDSALSLGGQAKESSAIENYPGFPEAITGAELIGRFIRQARKFCTTMYSPNQAESLERYGKELVVKTGDYQTFVSKSIILSLGLSWRLHEAKDITMFLGRGVSYGNPAQLPKRGIAAVVGGANSAGQAAKWLSTNPKLHVLLLVRKKIEDQMSTYLIDQIRATPNIEVLEGAELAACRGWEVLEEIDVKVGNAGQTIRCTAVLIFIGAVPKTRWLDGTVKLSDKKFILTGRDIPDMGARQPLVNETSIPGVFAAGDVRMGSNPRIVGAAADGAYALRSVHEHLASMA